jgi:hypothetical protein
MPVDTTFILLIIIILIIAHFFTRQPPTMMPYVEESFQSQHNIVICLLCVCPTGRVLEFAKRYAETHPVYVVCDDPNCEVPDNSPFTFVKLGDDVCKTSGYNNSNPAIPKRPSAWDKAIYYFCTQETKPGFVWFIEEDVFVPRESLFKELDARYPKTDYLMKQHVKDTDDPSFEFWYDGDGKMNRPFYRSLVCVTRVSRRMLDLVKQLHDSKKTLVFIEIMFNTLAVQNGLTMEMPSEFQTIIFRHTWTEDTVNNDAFFHPVKDTALHDTYRERLSQKTESNVM